MSKSAFCSDMCAPLAPSMKEQRLRFCLPLARLSQIRGVRQESRKEGEGKSLAGLGGVREMAMGGGSSGPCGRSGDLFSSCCSRRRASVCHGK